ARLKRRSATSNGSFSRTFTDGIRIGVPFPFPGRRKGGDFSAIRINCKANWPAAVRVLGIETSCDETGAAIYDSRAGLLAHAVHSQVALHREYGGVVPELASRDHVRRVLPLVRQVLAEAGLGSRELDGVAYTAGPGLVGALLVGASVGRSLAYAWGVPAAAVHHMEAHLLAPML